MTLSDLRVRSEKHANGESPGTLARAPGRLVGNTPLVEFPRLSVKLPHRIVGKCEFVNPHGSVKDRIGWHIVQCAEAAGLITPGVSTLVEGTAGNTGLSLVAAAAGRYQLICTMSTKVGADKEMMLRARGANVIRCPYDVAPDDPASFLNTARRIADTIDHGYYVNQFENLWNVEAHYLTTGAELVSQVDQLLDGNVAAFVSGAGTGGTFTGVCRRLVEAGVPGEYVIADPEGSVITDAFHGRPLRPGPYLIEGIGSDFVPPLLDLNLANRVMTVRDEESIQTCMNVVRTEGLFLGGSSGCALAAAIRLARELPGPRSTIVVILPDGGDRYVSTIYNADWRAARGLAESMPAGKRNV